MILDGMTGRVEHNYPLKNITTWKIGGPAEHVYWPETQTELIWVVREAQNQGIDLRVVGRGSNLLVPDQGLAGITVISTELKSIVWRKDYTVQVETGYSLAKLAQEAGERGWSGLEFARGIPGTVGGAVVMNAGAHGGDIAGKVRRVKALSGGEVHILTRDALEFGYRKSPFQNRTANHGLWVLEAELSFVPGERENILAQMKENLRRRADSQPLAEPNAGSVFRNPPGDSAARLIEAAGWKGREHGGAQVSPKHSNFIVNTGEATAHDILHLIKAIRQDVWEKFGVSLQPEIRYLATEEEAGLWPWIAM